MLSQLNAHVRQYMLVTFNYWNFTLTDGALRMLVVLYFYDLGYSSLAIASLFLFYEFFWCRDQLNWRVAWGSAWAESHHEHRAWLANHRTFDAGSASKLADHSLGNGRASPVGHRERSQ